MLSISVASASSLVLLGHQLGFETALAVAGAEKLIRREIDGNAHKALLDELAAEI